MVSETVTVTAIPVRFCFFKTGLLQFISHLDLARTMTQALLRAGIPVAFSGGFNPRPKIVFSLPLSIGAQSEREYMDCKITEPMSFEEMKTRLNAQLPPMLQITEVREQGRKFSEIGYAGYEIRIQHPDCTAALAAKTESLFHGDMGEVTVLKRSKSGEKDTDIAPFIRAAAVKFLPESGEILIHAKLSATSAEYLNPEYLLRAAEKYCGLCFDDPLHSGYSILRRELYLSDGITIFA